jgi:gamma-glutamyl:cysteine ligase YbdK (ATP-grasp superfamily)
VAVKGAVEAANVTIGTEHEYSINDKDFEPQPVNDRIIEELHGSVVNEFQFGDVNLSKELQKTVLEIVPAVPATDLIQLEGWLQSGVKELNRRVGDRYQFLGLGMHPLLKLEQTAVWDHEDKEIYDCYHRLFDIRQHGWLNIQALQINVPFRNDAEMVALYNRLRSLIPYLAAVGASSPLVEGKLTGKADNRLIYYRQNQSKLPIIAHNLVPERLTSLADYHSLQRRMYAELEKNDARILCHEWVDSRGVIVRFSRDCVEVKAIDEQECIKSDMAITAFTLALLRSPIELDEDENTLLELTEKSIEGGVAQLRPELRRLHAAALKAARPDERRFLPLIATKIESGSLAEVVTERVKEQGILRVLKELAACWRDNVPFQCGDCRQRARFDI